MKKRTALFKVLKNSFFEFIKSTEFLVICMIAFAIIGAIIGFNVSKVEPIPLTEDEIRYYTSQAEVGLYKGISYLDEGTIFIPDSYNTRTVKVYMDNQPDQKQKIKFTYSNKEIVKTEPYYSYSFFGNRVLGAIVCAILGLIVFFAISTVIEWIAKKVSSIREEMLKELEEHNSETNEED